MAEIIVGIDLGTTNSEVAVVQDGKPRVISVDGDPILPSVVGLSDDGKLLVGRPARNQYVLAPDRTVKSVKRKMGQDVKVPLGDQLFRPQEISAMVLRKLKDAAEKDLGHPVTKAVVTVPAYFNDTQRQATREAGALAGLDVVRILNEPTAAALTYNPDQSSHEKFLVYDLGGGTFDVSIVQAEAGVFEVLSSHGDTQLGGDDFDDLLMNHIADEFQKLYGVDLRASNTSKARLLRAAENAKKHLSDHPFARVEEEFIAEKDGVPLHLNIELARDDFEELIAPLITRTMDCVQKALDDAKLTAAQIQRVVLVGGSTRTPMIARLLEQRLGQPAHKEIHPDLCVALGAAVQAAIIAGESVGAVLVDITPHTLGIKCLEFGGSYLASPNEFKFAPIVPRNTPLPTTRSEAFCTVSDNQAVVDIEVFQGESGDVRRNHRIGKFLIEGLARVPAGNQIVVELNLTLDGTLKVSAREKMTGLVKQITIENAMARFAVEERDAAKERLERLWADPEYDTDGEDGEEELTEGTSVGDLLDEADEYFRDEDDDSEDAPPFGDEEDSEAFDDEPATAPAMTAPRVVIPAPAASPAPAPTAAAEPGAKESAEAARLLAEAAQVRGKASAEDQAELDKLTARVTAALTEKRWQDLKSACNELENVVFYLK